MPLLSHVSLRNRCVAAILLLTFVLSLSASASAAPLTLACEEANDLYRVLRAGGANCPRFATAEEAIRAAERDAGVLILADGYPQRTTRLTPALLEEAGQKRLRLYVEYPEWLPDLAVGSPKQVKFERGVVVSELFGESLRPMRIVLVSSCRYLPVSGPVPPAATHLAVAKVAGMDTAVFGLKDAVAEPLLFEHPRGNLLVATTNLSHFVRGRYLPADAWSAIWKTILARLQGGGPPPALPWTPAVRPTYAAVDPLPADVEVQAVQRSADWITRASRTLRHPDWPAEALDRARTYNTVRDMPQADWPRGDGSLGILEGLSSTLRSDGSQPMRYAVRNDCMGEVAMLLQLDATLSGRAEHARVAAGLLDYTFGPSGLAGGPRADPQSASFGLVGWALDSPGSYWGDDNARALLGAGAVAALANDRRWNEWLARCILANFRTTGADGFRESCIAEQALQTRGWKSYWAARPKHYSPHYQGWIWGCYLWAYQQTRFEPLLARSKAGLRKTMQAYPARWDWCLRSGTIERARLLLPLAWLVRVDDTPEHRDWLRTVARDLIALQDPCGAIREVIGNGGPGVSSNKDYGTGETSLIQADGDPVADLLYSCNFALIGLHEAAAATQDPFYTAAEDKLARFLCRIQVRSEAHPELDGAWYRAFDFRRWDYWASSADWEWGPWCIETGWCQPWIAGTLALRQRKLALWDLVGKVDLREPLQRLRPQMLPEEVLRIPPAQSHPHAAVGKRVQLASPADPRYPADGPDSLVDGTLGTTSYHQGEWLGFHGKDLEAVLDLGEPVQVRAVGVNCLQATAVGIFLPQQVDVAVSEDGQQYRAAAVVKSELAPQEAGPLIRCLRAEFAPQSVRFVRIRAKSMGTIPAGHAGRGLPAWMFVDELLVNSRP